MKRSRNIICDSSASEFTLDGVTPELTYNQTYKLIARQTNSMGILSDDSDPIYFTYRYLDFSTISDFDENIYATISVTDSFIEYLLLMRIYMAAVESKSN